MALVFSAFKPKTINGTKSVSADNATRNSATQTDGVSQSTLSPKLRKRAERRTWWFSRVVIPLLFLSLFAAVPAIALSRHHHRRDSDPIRYQQPSTNERLNQVKAILFENESTPQQMPSPAEIERIALALDQVSASIEFARVQQSLSQYESAASEWDKLYEITLTDEVGDQLAQIESLLSKFVALIAMEPPDSIPASFESELKRVKAVATNASEPAEAMRELSEVNSRALAWYQYHQLRSQLLQKLRIDAKALSPTGVSLKDVLQSHDEQIAAKRKLMVENATKETEVSLQSSLDDLKALRDEQSQVIALLQRQLADVQNGKGVSHSKGKPSISSPGSKTDYEQELPAIRKILRPFISPGYTQPNSANELKYGNTKIPMSYSALQRVGALVETDQGRAILFRLGGSKSNRLNNDRPLGTFPGRVNEHESPSDEVLFRLKEAQRLLNSYGLLMIEDRLLSP